MASDQAQLEQEKSDRERLEQALAVAAIPVTESCDLDAIAREVGWAFTWQAVFSEAESIGLAQEQKAWFEKVRNLAAELADLLKSPPGNAGVWIDTPFDASRFHNYGLMSPLELEPMLRALGNAARNVIEKSEELKRPLNQPAAPKIKGSSPTSRLIQKLADIYEKHASARAYIGRTNAEGEKGGKFFDFVNAAAKEWKCDPPSVEAVRKALEKRPKKRD